MNTARLLPLLLLFSLYCSGVALAEELPMAQMKPPTVTQTQFTFTRNLAVGSSGKDVDVLQTFLIEKRYLKIPAVTGYFGPRTRAAVAAWQAATGISPAVGRFGPISRGKLHLTHSALASKDRGTVIAAVTTAARETVHSKGLLKRLKIPVINVDAAIEYVGLTAGGAMDVPKNANNVAWFNRGPRPGELGSAVIAGHRDSATDMTSVFNELHELRKGDKVDVVEDNGRILAFVVREIREYDELANATEVFTTYDGAHLNLVTCSGVWDRSKKSYSKRLVVFTDIAE